MKVAIKQILLVFRFCMVPYYNGAYLANYIRLLDQVPLIRKRRIVALLNGYFHLKAAQFLWLALFPLSTDFERFLHFDFLELSVPNGKFNFLAALYYFLIPYFIRNLFLEMDHTLVDSLKGILIHKDTSWFLSELHRGKSIVRQIERIFYSILTISDNSKFFTGNTRFFNRFT